MHEVLVNRLGGLSLPRKSVVRLTDRPDMTLDVYRGRKTTIQLLLLSLFFPLGDRAIQTEKNSASKSNQLSKEFIPTQLYLPFPRFWGYCFVPLSSFCQEKNGVFFFSVFFFFFF